MKTTTIATFLLFLSFGLATPPALVAAPAAASRPRMAILPFANEAGGKGGAAACLAASRAFAMAVRGLGMYELVSPDPSAVDGDEAIRAWAMSRNVDYVVRGKVTQAGSDKKAFTLAIFDRAKGCDAISRKSDPVGALDLLDAVDEVVARTLSQATGKHIAFGSLAFENKGESGDYQVIVDGAPIGSNLISLDSVLAGKHTICVVQDRMLGPLELVSRTIDLAEGGRAAIEFSVPGMTDEEQARLTDLDAEILALRDDPARRADIDADVQAYVTLTSQVKYSPAPLDRAPRARQLQAEWILAKNRQDIEAGAWEPASALLGPSLQLSLEADSYADPEAIRSGVADNASILCTFLELGAGNALAEGEYAAAEDDFRALLGASIYVQRERAIEYAYGASTLAAILATSSDRETIRDLTAVFGPTINAGLSFYTLRKALAEDPAAVAVVPSNLGSLLRVGDGSPVRGPFLASKDSLPSLAIASGDEKAPTYAEATPRLEEAQRIAFVDTGINYFERAATQAAAMMDQRKADTGRRRNTGTLSFDWLPDDIGEVNIYGNRVPLFKTFDGRPVTASMGTGKVWMGVKIAGKEQWVSGNIRAGGDTRVQPPSATYLSVAYAAKKKEFQTKRLLNFTFGFGLAGAGALGLFQADSTSKVLGATALGLGAVIVATTPSKATIDASLKKLDSQIARFAYP